MIDPAKSDSDEAWREMARLLSCVYQKDFPLTSQKNGKTTLNLKGSVPWNFSGMHSDDDFWKFILSKVHGTDDDDK